MLNVWKGLFIGKVFGKTWLPSKSPYGSAESRSDNPPDNFPPKVRFFHKIWKLPPLPAPFLRKNIKVNIFPGKFFSWRNLYGLIKTQFSQSAFKVQKTSAECLEKVLKTLIQPRKNRLPKENPPEFRIQFWQTCWGFSKMVRNFAPKCYEKKCSISETNYPIAYNFPGKKIAPDR